MGLTWLACQARTGQVVAELPDLDCPRVSALMGAVTTTEATLPAPTAPPGWVQATVPWATYLALVSDDEAAGALWAGMVVRRRRSLDGEVSLSLASAEAHLGRVYTPDLTLVQQPQTQIAAALAQAMTGPGSPWQVDAGTSTVLRDRTYADAADGTVLEDLGELAGVQGGPEWTVRWDRLDEPTRVVPVLVVRDRIGAARRPGLWPGAVFEAPGCVTQVELVEDYGEGMGATVCTATSTGLAEEVRPQASRSAAVTDRLAAEYRWSPSTSISDVATLDAHAARALEARSSGTTSLTLVAALDAAPTLGVDWGLGDDVGYVVQAGAFDALPDGLSGVSRAVGWELSLSGVPTVAPVLAGGDLS